MKKTLLIILVLVFAFTSNATVITVSNDPATVAQYADLQIAIDNALDGDTLYIHGSAVTYPRINVTDKQICIIGPGYSPDIELPQPAKIFGVNIKNTSATGTPSGSEFQGLIFDDFLYVGFYNQDLGMSNIKFKRCQFNDFVRIGYNNENNSQFLFEGNYFNGANLRGSNAVGSSFGNFIIRNNIFRNSAIQDFTYTTDFLIDHNLFYTSSNQNVFDVQMQGLLITNNIFYKANAENAQNSTFKNNITYIAGNNMPWDANTNIDGGGNVANQNPQIADATAVNNGVDDPLLDFSIAAGPANNSGLDGKDMGLLFDATGPNNWTFTRNARLPRVTIMQIVNPTIAPGDDLNVALEAKVSQ